MQLTVSSTPSNMFWDLAQKWGEERGHNFQELTSETFESRSKVKVTVPMNTLKSCCPFNRFLVIGDQIRLKRKHGVQSLC